MLKSYGVRLAVALGWVWILLLPLYTSLYTYTGVSGISLVVSSHPRGVLCRQVLREYSSGMLGDSFPSFFGVFSVYGDRGATFVEFFKVSTFQRIVFEYVRERRELRGQPPATSNLSTVMWCSCSLATRRTSHTRRLLPSSAHHHTSTHTQTHTSIFLHADLRESRVCRHLRDLPSILPSLFRQVTSACVLGSTPWGMPLGGLDIQTCTSSCWVYLAQLSLISSWQRPGIYMPLLQTVGCRRSRRRRYAWCLSVVRRCSTTAVL